MKVSLEINNHTIRRSYGERGISGDTRSRLLQYESLTLRTYGRGTIDSMYFAHRNGMSLRDIAREVGSFQEKNEGSEIQTVNDGCKQKALG